MELGQRLRQARLEAGMSQRQLCGEVITRNMLSLIENGSARPSMDTLRYLAARLGKPMGYFLEEQAVTSPNQALMAQARVADPADVLALLRDYQAPDEVFDRERYLLEVLSCMVLAERAIRDGKPGLAASLLAQASTAGGNTPYYTPELEQRRILLLARTGTEKPAVLASLLPDNTEELLLRAEGALETGELDQAATLLESAQQQNARWHWLQAEVYFAREQYRQAAAHYEQAAHTPKVYARLEHCYRELRDFEKAYFYACKQR